MPAELVSHAVVGLAPVLTFLAALLYLDSYKLVSLRLVVAVVACGVLAAIVCYFANGLLIRVTRIDVQAFARYVAPLTEEIAKAIIVVALVRDDRIGFLVDAAIIGFAAGTGFAIVENLYYGQLLAEAGVGTWIVRGFGTAIMHGATTATFAIIGLTLRERTERRVLAYLPGFALAVVIHAAFNRMFVSPRAATLVVVLVLPPLMYFVFRRSERAVGDWLGRGFDSDAQMLELIGSGKLPDSPVGRYLSTLRRRFRGPVVADLLCYLRLHKELALRAKGILMMRENGFEVPVDEETRAKFVELRYLEKSIGKSGLLALKPLLHMTHKDLWQLYMLGEQ